MIGRDGENELKMILTYPERPFTEQEIEALLVLLGSVITDELAKREECAEIAYTLGAEHTPVVTRHEIRAIDTAESQPWEK